MPGRPNVAATSKLGAPMRMEKPRYGANSRSNASTPTAPAVDASQDRTCLFMACQQGVQSQTPSLPNQKAITAVQGLPLVDNLLYQIRLNL